LPSARLTARHNKARAIAPRVRECKRQLALKP
jgi:hypothetical protein